MQAQEAFAILHQEANREDQPTQARLNRAIKACQILGLDPGEWLFRHDIINADGKPYNTELTLKGA